MIYQDRLYDIDNFTQYSLKTVNVFFDCFSDYFAE